MDDPNASPTETNSQNTEPPAPEVLTPRPAASDASVTPDSAPGQAVTTPIKAGRRRVYRPSHRGTFLGIAAVVVILMINAVIVAVVLKSQSRSGGLLGSAGEVTINQGVLDRIGVNRGVNSTSGLELVVSPNARFNSEVKVGGSVSIGGGLKINSKFSAADATLTQLEAGKVSLSELNVNKDTTVSNLNLRGNLQVNGTTKLQGAITMSQLLTVNNNVNILGSLSIGGTLSTNGLSVRNLAVSNSFTFGGHFITSGSSPSVTRGGSALGSSGTVGISGNDTAGTVSVNIGVGATAGVLANVTFHTRFSNIPHVVITPVGAGGNFYITRSTTGFSIVTNSALAPAGMAFDYIVAQ